MNRFDALPHIASRYRARRERYRASGDWSGTTLGVAFRSAVDGDPAQRWTFLVEGQETQLSTRQLGAEAERFGRALAATRDRPDGAVVGIALPNSPGAVTAFYGTQLAGRVAFPMSMREGEESLRHLLDVVGVDHLVIAEHDEQRAAWARRHAAPLAPRLWLADSRGGIRRDDDGASPPGILPDVTDGVHLISYTSGSTSTPKIVLHTDDQLLAESASLREVFSAWGTILVSSPVGHITGILHLLTLPMLRKGDVVAMDRWDAARAVELCRRHGAESLAGTSLYYHAMEELDPHLGGLRGGIAGGGPVTPAIVRRLDLRAGISVVRSYGSTEHPTISQSLPTDPLEARASTDGMPCRGVEIRVVDANGVAPPTGTQGEIHSRGPDAMAGYLDAALDAASCDSEGWVRSGDIGFVDHDGRLTISDRVKDIVLRAGENISTKEVEDVLHEWEAVREAAVVGVPDQGYGERACAFLRTAGGSVALEDLRAFLSGTQLEKFKWPEYVVTVTEFPRTASGKVRKQALREGWSREIAGAS